ncbi:MAG: bacillithiol biosynthesis cysteine-adding enzyme BshC, partial [Bacteroidota bacterium]
MKIVQVPFKDVPQFSERDKAYTTSSEMLRPFYAHEVHLEAFQEVIARKQKAKVNRPLLVEVLQAQYETFTDAKQVRANINALSDEQTFTVITAHQPSLFTGPLYFIYKIFSVINLAEGLRKKYPEQQFVPVFVLGSEDHDFEEINHLHLFGKRLEWQSEEQGATGTMKTDTLEAVLQELQGILGESEHARSVYATIQKAFTKYSTYAKAMQCLIHELLGQYGLVVCNMNDKRLKTLFVPHIQKEIFEQPSESLVLETQAKLEEVGFSAQAMPRPINFFYLRDQIRERIVQDGRNFKVLNTEVVFSPEQMQAEIANYPERFSPNVVMRPIYQEVIFPNLAYVGGGGELAYWLERKSQFAHFGVPFPMLIRRNS